MTKYTVETPSKVYLESIVKDLSRVRCWVAGFVAAGGTAPAHADVLWRAQMLLGDAKAIEAGTDETAPAGSARKGKSAGRKASPKASRQTPPSKDINIGEGK